MKYLFVFVDDGIPIGPMEELCTKASRKWDAICSWLVIQDASRKVQQPSQAPGPCAGTLTHKKEGVCGWYHKTGEIIPGDSYPIHKRRKGVKREE